MGHPGAIPVGVCGVTGRLHVRGEQWGSCGMDPQSLWTQTLAKVGCPPSHRACMTWRCWRLRFQPGPDGMLQPVQRQEGSNHQCMSDRSLPPDPQKGDAAEASAASRNGEEGLVQCREKENVLTQLEPDFVQLRCKSRSVPALPTWLEKSERQSSLLLSCTAQAPPGSIRLQTMSSSKRETFKQ